MAKNQNTFEKHRREVEKRRKAEEKRERRRKKKKELHEATADPSSSVDNSGPATD